MHRRRGRFAAALSASVLVHAAAASAVLWHRDRVGGDTIRVELVEIGQPLPTPDETAELPALAPASSAVPFAADPAHSTEVAPGIDDHVSALVAERDALAARLEFEAGERMNLGEQLAALTVEKGALADELADERRRAALREKAHADRLAADRAMHEELLTALRREIDEKDIELRRSREGLAVSIVDRVLFASGQASLSRDGRAVIDKVAKILTGAPEQRIVVEGHTDDVPIGAELAERFPSNWELSTARAAEVVRQLAVRGVPPRLLEAVGRADTRPAVSNATEAGRRRNRRIEIILPGPAPRLDHGEAGVDGGTRDQVNRMTWETQP